jgi:hypothetical protein
MLVRVILGLAVVGITIYSFIDCLRSDDAEIRTLPKPVWLVLVVLFPPVGGVLWILLGRIPAIGGPNRGGQPRVVAPDDDPDFLRSLDPPKPRPTPQPKPRPDATPDGRTEPVVDPEDPAV